MASWVIGGSALGRVAAMRGFAANSDTASARQPFPGRRVGGMDRGVPDGEGVVLDVSQLQTLLRKSFNIGIDPDPRKPRALNRLELAKGTAGRGRGERARGEGDRDRAGG